MDATKRRALVEALLGLVPSDGSQIGNQRLREQFQEATKAKGTKASDADFEALRESLIEDGTLTRGKGRGGSVRRAKPDDAQSFGLAPQTAPEPDESPKKTTGKSAPRAKAGSDDPQVLSYRHSDKRKNNPQVGLVNETTDPPTPKTVWKYDPHIDPALSFDMGRAQVEKIVDGALASRDEKSMRDALEYLKRVSSPYLNWTGKAERTSFEIDTVSLHVHERIDPMSILAAVSKQIKNAKAGKQSAIQPGLFEAPFESLPLRDAVDFYKHERGWSNRLIAGDSLLVMTSLIQKESMAGQVQMIYIDPPYGIEYRSNFQPFTNKRDVKDRKDADLTQEPEMIKAFRDTWELDVHSYLTYLRDRVLLAHNLLTESGSIFIQISDENLHRVRAILDEIFGAENFVSCINFQSMTPLESGHLETVFDYLVWYAKDIKQLKYRNLYREKPLEGNAEFKFVTQSPGYRILSDEEAEKEFAPDLVRTIFKRSVLESSGFTPSCTFPFAFNGAEPFSPRGGKSWRTNPDGMRRLARSDRLFVLGTKLYFKLYFQDFSKMSLLNTWPDTVAGYGETKIYVVQTHPKVIERCMLMTTDPGDLVFDPTCGSGTSAFVAEKWGRRWITCDTSRVSITLAKQRLMTASYDYFQLRYPHEGLKGGFIYKTVPHVTLKSIAQNPDVDEIYERMHPAIEGALKGMNAALRKRPPIDPFAVAEGGRKSERLNFSEGASLQEWEVPYTFPQGWHSSVRETFDAFHAMRQSMHKQMELSVAAHADSEILYDQPEKSKTKMRITGPFSVEAVPFPTVL
ncbi:MAG: DNA methyltransferase, partial [Pirellulaceae bacterium]